MGRVVRGGLIQVKADISLEGTTDDIKQRMLEIGVTGVEPERRSPEYLAKFVAEEVKRWEGPIISGGFQVD